MRFSKDILFVCGFLVSFVESYDILVFFPYPSKSHTILGEGYVKILTKVGHNVTYVTPILVKDPPKNLRQIDVSSNFNDFKFGDLLDIKKILAKEIDFSHMMPVYRALHDIAHIALMHDRVQALMMDTSERFDVVITEWLYSDLYSGVGAVFGCPYIWSSSIEPHPMILRLIDDTPNPAVIPDHMSALTPPLTFLERAGELWNLLKLYYIRWSLYDLEVAAFKQAYSAPFAARNLKLPSIEDVKYNASLILGNSHVSSGLALKIPQNYIPIAGYHVNEDVAPLSENLQTIMDRASDGVIYFSLGSMMQGKTMPEELKRGFLATFSELRQTVIWKLEMELSDVPDNVHIVKWAPQQSILAHPKTILFITHGGLLSTIETLHFGVPVIGIPLFADQGVNVKMAVKKGFGKEVHIGHDAPTELKAAIADILQNPSYREKVKELSLVYHDRPVSPAKEMTHWVEHVARTGGAMHLRSAALMTPWYQKIYLDLAAVILSIPLLAIFLVKSCLTSKFRSKVKLG